MKPNMYTVSNCIKNTKALSPITERFIKEIGRALYCSLVLTKKLKIKGGKIYAISTTENMPAIVTCAKECNAG